MKHTDEKKQPEEQKIVPENTTELKDELTEKEQDQVAGGRYTS